MIIEDWGDVYYSGPGKRGGSWWPVGSHYVPADRLKQVLAFSARHHARQAVAQSISNNSHEILQAAISCGCAVELLAKAYIASVEHCLLSERGDRDTILILAGKAHHADTGVDQIRTIGAAEALRLAKYLHKTLAYTPATDDIVLRIRNSAAHMALVSRAELRRAIASMCGIVDGLLEPLNLDRAPFWGDVLAAVDEIEDQTRSERTKIVATKIAVARRFLAKRLQGLDVSGQRAVLAVLSGQQLRSSDHDERRPCPACKQDGWLLCSIEKGNYETSYDDDGMPSGAFVPRTAFPFAFECAVCSLELEADELLGHGFPDQIELEPEDFIEPDYEPDEDLLRGR